MGLIFLFGLTKAGTPSHSFPTFWTKARPNFQKSILPPYDVCTLKLFNAVSSKKWKNNFFVHIHVIRLNEQLLAILSPSLTSPHAKHSLQQQQVYELSCIHHWSCLMLAVYAGLPVFTLLTCLSTNVAAKTPLTITCISLHLFNFSVSLLSAPAFLYDSDNSTIVDRQLSHVGHQINRDSWKICPFKAYGQFLPMS
jgi:hypothetical protein